MQGGKGVGRSRRGLETVLKEGEADADNNVGPGPRCGEGGGEEGERRENVDPRVFGERGRIGSSLTVLDTDSFSGVPSAGMLQNGGLASDANHTLTHTVHPPVWSGCECCQLFSRTRYVGVRISCLMANICFKSGGPFNLMKENNRQTVMLTNELKCKRPTETMAPLVRTKTMMGHEWGNHEARG